MVVQLKEALKGRLPVIYARVSTDEQKGTLNPQVKELKEALLAIGVKREPVVFKEQISGTLRTRDRPALKEMTEFLEKKAGKAAIVVRDTQRLSRNPWIAGAIYDPLRELDIPLVSFEAGGKVASTDKTPQVEGDLLMPILTAIGGQEISLRKEQSGKGTKQSRAKGIYSGTPLELFPKLAFSPIHELVGLLPLIVSKEMTGVGVSDRLGRSTKWMRDRRDHFAEIRESGADFEEWLSVLTMLRTMEQRHGKGFGEAALKPMRAVRRMTSGYVAEPWNFEAPTQADLDDYLKNYVKYQPKRTK